MSSASNITSTPSNFETLIDVALVKYTKRTGQDIRKHPIASVFDECKSPESIFAVFQEQSRAFDEFRNGDPKLVKWLTPIVDVLYNISTKHESTRAVLVSQTQFHILLSTSFNAYSQAFPANIILSGIGILLSVSVVLALSSELTIMFVLSRRQSM